MIHDPFRLNHNLLARVNLVTMQSFVLACKQAAEDCALAMNNKLIESSLLHHLLDDRKLPSHIAVQGTSQSKKKDDNINIGPTSLILENPFIGNENPYQDLTDLISMIFEKILLLDVSQSKEATEHETNCKVSKTDTMKDVHENSHSHSMLVCEGKTDVWNGRKKAKQMLRLNNPLSFQDEEKISNLLSQENKGKDTNVPVAFQCKLLCEAKTCTLLFEDFCDTKRNFKIFWMSVRQLLPKWVIGLNQELSKS